MRHRTVFYVPFMILCLVLTGCTGSDSNLNEADSSYAVETGTDKSNCSFEMINFDGANKVYILNGINGQEVTVTETEKIEQITSLISGISGSDGVSSQGYNGYLYLVEIYSDETLLFKIVFTGNEGDKQYFNYGIYETSTVNGKVFEYPGRYVMEGTDSNSLQQVFGELFE